MSQIMNLVFDSNTSVFEVRDVNSSFARASLRVMYLGDNRNGSHFDKDVVTRALPTLKNVPIVCNYDYENWAIGAHDVEIATDKNGDLFLRNLTEPCGVVPEHATTEFIVEKDEDGDEHEYLVVHDVLLWKRQDVYRHIVDNLGGKVKHSMEINVGSGRRNSSGYYVVDEFEFTALCLLGDAEPCFQGSRLELYSASHFKKKMDEMMADLKVAFTAVNSPTGEDNYNNSTTAEGGKILENTNETNHGNDTTPAISSTKSSESFALAGNIISELTRILQTVTYESFWGECNRYVYVDCDMEIDEVYCYDIADLLLYGFRYHVEGDTITIDFASKARKKYVIADFEGGDEPSPLNQVFAQIMSKFDDINEIKSKLDEAYSTINELNEEVESLTAYKTEVELATAKAAREAVLDKFHELDGAEEFENLREHGEAFDASELEEKCFAILGRLNATDKRACDGGAVRLVVPHTTEVSDPYGGVVDKFTKSNK